MTRLSRSWLLVLGLALCKANTYAAITDLASSPLVTSSSNNVYPNIMYLLDDSGSMDWDYLPDWVNDNNPPDYLYKNHDFNGVAYNPGVTYSPPSYFNSDGTVNTSTYPGQTAANTSNWTAVKNDGYGVQFSGTSNLVNNAYAYVMVSGEFCATPAQKSCNTQTAANTSYPYPAKLRWCNSSALTNCQVSYNQLSGYNFTYVRTPSPSKATISISGSSSTSVSSIKVNGVEILSAATTATSTASTVASRVISAINSCSNSLSGNCGTVGYTATSSGSTVTITSPDGNAYSVAVTLTGGMSVTIVPFASGSVPGTILRETITSSVSSYPYPGTSTKASTRTDCAGSTCSYAEEMTNYANWWAYYRTRMQMMKTAASLAFSTLGSNYRVGYITINANAGGYLPLTQFSSSNKKTWYDKFFAAVPGNGTPLRVALSAVGRYYAGKKPTYTSPASGNAVNLTDDPIQYSCQQNFTILSTDGYWNESPNPTQLNGSTSIGNQDGTEPRPYNDGSTISYTQNTSQLQETKTQVFQSTSQQLKRVQQVQSSTNSLQKQTSQLQEQVSQLQSQTTQLQKQTSQLQKRTKSGGTWSAWANTSSTCTAGGSVQCQYVVSSTVGASSCTPQSASGSSPYTVINPVACNSVITSPYANVSSCAATTTPDVNGYTTQCQYTTWNTIGLSSCIGAVAQSTGPNYTVATAYRNCSTVITTPYANVSSCTVTTVPDTSGYTTQCQYAGWTSFANASSCTPLSPSSGSPYSVGTATQCQITDTGWVGASACTAGSSNGQTVTCQTATSGPTLVASCSSQLASSGNNYVQTSCTTSTIEPATGVATCTPASASSGNNYVTTSCATVTTGPSSVSSCTAQTPSASNNWLTINCSANASGGTSNTLADTAEYYYSTDLRTTALSNCSVSFTSGGTTTTNDVCANNVPKSGSDSASWQHMTTFTLGLGASGAMLYSPSYATATSGDYFDVKNGTLTNTSSGICSWQTTGACNWPVPSSNTQTTIDDLWHAAVDGRGTYYSATDPTSLVVGLSGALAGVSARTGASAAATTSNPNVTSGDNFVFSSTFTTQNWDGELVRQQLDLTTGIVQSTIDWSAQAQLDANTSRNIYFFSSGATNNLKTFTWSNLSTTQQSYFTLPAISTLSQFCVSGVTCLSTSAQTQASGANLVAFLTGDRTNEGASTDTTKYYRQRSHVLGDIVNAEAVYVKKPMFAYADYGYTDFVTANSTRQGIVYAAANDGMLHAFYAADGATGVVGGAEAWAYVPSIVMPNMFALADKNYANQHQYFVDGTPVVADICTSYCATPVPPATSPPAVWKTILIGGFNGGGRGYYALDITNPATPKALWEFTDTNMGYSYGNPEIAKLSDGTWVVFVASGYNNVSPGDGVGRLYVLNAATGALIRTISTNAGSTSTPSGLARIRAWVDDATVDNTALRVYGGDLLGNLWRFDVNNIIPPAGYEAQLLATLKDGLGNVQPITAKPELGSYTSPMVFVGTGKYLGASDLADTTQQSMYGIKDPLDTTNYGSPRSSSVSHFVQQTLTTTTCPANSPSTICSSGEVVRTSTNNSVNYSTDSGWYFDFPIQGERDNTDPTLALGTLGFTTNVPNSNACNVGGESYRYFLDYRTGGAVSTSTTAVVATKLGNALATRPVYVRLPNNTIVELTRLSDGTTVTSNVPIGSGAGVTKRVSWRELVNDQ